MYEYLAPIKAFFDLLKGSYDTIKKYGPSKKKNILGKELIKILLQLQVILSYAEKIMILIKNSKNIIKEKGSNKYINVLRESFKSQAHNIYLLQSLFMQEQVEGLLSILMLDTKNKLLKLIERKGSALYFVEGYLSNLQIKIDKEDVYINSKINFHDLEDIRNWVRKSENIKLLEEVDAHEIIIKEIKEQTEELRKFIIETFSLEEILSYI